MAQQTINVGTAPNDGTGTPLRTAFQYTNSNFTELYTATGPSGNNITVPGNATITGDLTVDTSTLKVDSANNRVGIGTASPVATLQSAGTFTISGGSAASSANGLHQWFETGTNTAYISAFHSGVDNRALSVDAKTISFTIAGSEKYALSATGIATWSNVGGVAGTAMTLNATGLGVGGSPTKKFEVVGTASATVEIGKIGAASGPYVGIGTEGTNYSWIQAFGGKPLQVNPQGNDTILNPSSGNVLIGTISAAFSEKFRVYGAYTVMDDGAFTGFLGKASSLGASGATTDFGIRSSNALIFLSGGATERMRIDSSGNVIVNTAAVATTATDGFLYIPGCAGTPTGTPTAKTGRVPLVVDTTNNKLYFYSGGAWVAAN